MFVLPFAVLRSFCLKKTEAKPTAFSIICLHHPTGSKPWPSISALVSAFCVRGSFHFGVGGGSWLVLVRNSFCKLHLILSLTYSDMVFVHSYFSYAFLVVWQLFFYAKLYIWAHAGPLCGVILLTSLPLAIPKLLLPHQVSVSEILCDLFLLKC